MKCLKTKVAFLSHLDLNLFLFRLSWMEALIEKGYEVYAIVPKGKFINEFHKYGIKTIEYAIDRGGLNPVSEFIVILKLYRIFKKEKFDILHTFTFKPNIYGAIAGELSGIPIIINQVTGLGSLYAENNLRLRILRFVGSFLYCISFKIAKKVIFQNPDDLEDIKHLLNINKAIIIRGTGVDINFFSSDKIVQSRTDELRKGYSINKNSVIITLIARLIWHKGIKEFVEAANLLAKKYNNLLFLIVGWIDKGNSTAVTEAFIQEVQRSHYIRFLGEREDIKEILALTDIYTLPSYREGTPRTVLEAMAMSKPIITTDVPGCRQTVEDGLNGFLVLHKDSHALAQALEKLILDKDLREKMGKASRDKVVREFSDDVVIKQVLKLYKDLEKQ